MKIIKQGKSKAEIEKIKNVVKRFKCLTCECVFEADNNEYKARKYIHMCRTIVNALIVGMTHLS